MALCPVCEEEMRTVSARANPGTLIVLDQCPKCGGIWCDQWELYPIDSEEASRLDPVDEKLLQSVLPAGRKTLYCPRCRDRLQAFRDPLLPPETLLERCPRCQGLWLNRGEFSRYKRFQQKKRKENLPHEDRIQKLAAAASDARAWVTTGTGGVFAYPRGETEDSDAVNDSMKGIARLTLQTVLRLLLGI
jgi:Zn-finger nucleic acid-binding protein